MLAGLHYPFRGGLSPVWFFLPLALVLMVCGYGYLVFERFFSGYLLLMELWVLGAMLGYACVLFLSPGASLPGGAPRYRASVSIDYAMLAVGALAILSLFYDRFFLRDINYLQEGIAGARQELNRSEDTSSLFSYFGNFFLYSYVFPLVRTLLAWEDRSWATRLCIIFLVGLELAAVSMLMGGRTAILLAIVLALGACAVRPVLGKPSRPESVGWPLILGLVCALFAVFAVFFALRSDAFGTGDSFSYYRNICGHLSAGMPLECDFGVRSGLFRDVVNYLHLVLLYGAHGSWMSEAIVNTGWSGGFVTLDGLYSLVFSRFGYEVPHHGFEGYFVPAPASLVHDFGPVIMLGFAALAGGIVGALTHRVRVRRQSVAVWILILLVACWLLSFLIFPANIPGLILIVTLGGVYWLFGRLARRIKHFSDRKARL